MNSIYSAKSLNPRPSGINTSTLTIDHIPDILTITHLSHMPYGDGVEPMFYNSSYIDYGPKQSQHLQHIKDYPERKLCPMSKNINLIYCLKKNKHRSYTGDYQKFLRRRQALGEAGLEYGVFKDKRDAMAFLGIAYDDPSTLSPEERRLAKQKKRTQRQARIQEAIKENQEKSKARQKKFYAVARGWHQKICFSWDEAMAETKGYVFPQYLGCDTIEEASAYIKEFNAKYKGMTQEEVVDILRNEKLKKLARRRRHMTEQEYQLARERIFEMADRCKKGYDEKCAAYHVHLGPRTPKEAERQYRRHVYVGNSTCWKLSYQRAPKKAS